MLLRSPVVRMAVARITGRWRRGLVGGMAVAVITMLPVLASGEDRVLKWALAAKSLTSEERANLVAKIAQACYTVNDPMYFNPDEPHGSMCPGIYLNPEPVKDLAKTHQAMVDRSCSKEQGCSAG